MCRQKPHAFFFRTQNSVTLEQSKNFFVVYGKKA